MAAAAQPKAFSPQLSHDKLTLADGGATATRAWGGEPHYPAALVAVGRGMAEGFSAAAVVETMPEAGQYLSFGVGRTMAKEGKTFGGWNAEKDS